MSEHNVPAGKLCPFISTAQVLISEIHFSSQSQKQQGMSLAGISGVGSASTPETSMAQGKAVAIHANPVFNEGTDTSKPVDSAQIKSYTAQPVSVPCVRDKCQGWDDENQDCGYKSKSASPAEALAAAQGLLNRASEGQDL